MSHFLRLLSESDKACALAIACAHLRNGESDTRCFELNAESFDAIPGKPFAYWTSKGIRDAFETYPSFASAERTAWVGLQTNDDFQWVRLWWESNIESRLFSLVPFAKGGAYSSFYSDIYLAVRWGANGLLIKTWKEQQLLHGLITANNSKCWNEKNYFDSGITWPSRTQQFGPRALPSGCVFGHKGPAAFWKPGDDDLLLALLAIMNSRAFISLVETRLNAADATARSFEVGIIEGTPVPSLSSDNCKELAALARRAWTLKRTLDSIEETSHAFLLPEPLRARLGHFDPPGIEVELTSLQSEINAISFDLYGFSEADRTTAADPARADVVDRTVDDAEDEEVSSESPVNAQSALLSWAVGVVFGRFDWRLASGERAAPSEPNPFDPLPAKSPAMLPDGAVLFHNHGGVLVDDQGHANDLGRLIEEVLTRVKVPIPDNVRRWLQRDFFAFHLQRYSRSRRKAPIYWPLSTSSGNYTLWLYYPSMTSETLYTAINDFVEPKIKQVGTDVTVLRNKGTARTRDDEKQFESLQSLELELIELRDTLLKLAPTYKPHQDDGVQITAVPLWPLFRYKPWQKILKETWNKLEKGDYDWAHLAMNYWPERVREKCRADKSLAIAHALKNLYIEPKTQPKSARGKKKAEVEE